MKKATIAIDVDDVLADNAAGFVGFSNRTWGTNLRPEDYDEHWAKVWQVDNAEVERRVREWSTSGILKSYAHDESALPVLNKLSQNFHLIIVTSRRQDMKNDTLAWIKLHYPGIFSDETIHFAGIWDSVDDHSINKTKADIVENLKADYLIDDQLKHCLAVADAGKTTLLFGNYTWNQSDKLPSNVIRVADWQGVERYFDTV